VIVKRYELSDAQWDRIALLLADKPGDPGRTGSDNRLFVNGVLWVMPCWFVSTSRPRAEKGGQRSGSGAFPRRIDHRDPMLSPTPRAGPCASRHTTAPLPPSSHRPRHGWGHRRQGPRQQCLARTHRRGRGRCGHPLAQLPQGLIPHDALAYKLRNRIERFFNKLKHFPHIATRYDHAGHFLAAPTSPVP
jgi:transposase